MKPSSNTTLKTRLSISAGSSTAKTRRIYTVEYRLIMSVRIVLSSLSPYPKPPGPSSHALSSKSSVVQRSVPSEGSSVPFQ